MAISETELLGTIKLGCMIPVYDEKIIEYYEVKNENDIKYKKLDIGYIKNTVNFKLLEEKAKEYK